MNLIEMVYACFPEMEELSDVKYDYCHRCGCVVNTALLVSAIDGKPAYGRDLHAHWHIAIEQSI